MQHQHNTVTVISPPRAPTAPSDTRQLRQREACRLIRITRGVAIAARTTSRAIPRLLTINIRHLSHARVALTARRVHPYYEQCLQSNDIATDVHVVPPVPASILPTSTPPSHLVHIVAGLR